MLTGLVLFLDFFLLFRAPKKYSVRQTQFHIAFSTHFYTIRGKESVIFQTFSNQVDGIHQMKYKPSGLDLKSIAADLFTPIYKLNLLK